MHDLDPLHASFWLPVGLAVFCGGVLGLERQLRGKPAGIRTSALVCLGSMLFVRLGAATVTAEADPTRVLGQIVTGVGFLGAGVILSNGGNIRGVTSAAVIWTLAAIGAAIGLDQFGAALGVTAVGVVLLSGMHFLERAFGALRRGVHADVDAIDDEPA